jgi:hypothetical protein
MIEGNVMLERIRVIIANLLYILLWIGLAALVALTLFQVHATLISLGIYMVDNPDLRPSGWNSGSIAILSRLLWLVVGIIWLGSVMFMHEILGEDRRLKTLGKRVFLLLLILGGIYGASYFILLVLA